MGDRTKTEISTNKSKGQNIQATIPVSLFVLLKAGKSAGLNVANWLSV